MPTSPAPDAAAPPGMCPGVVVKGGGGGSGGGSGDGSGNGSGAGGGGGGSGNGTSGDGKDAQGAPDYAKYPECGYASHPVDVVTGRAFTHPITDLDLPGPLPLQFNRMYSSKMADRDVGLGYGWAHTFGWEIEVTRREIRVWNEQGIAVDFPMIDAGGEVLGPWGWLLRREAWGFMLDADDGVFRLFSAADERRKRYRLTAIEDRCKNRIALTYENDRLVEVVDSAGRVIRLSSTREGRITSIQVKNAVAQGSWVAFAVYTYDDRGNLTAVQDADGFSSRYAYDDEHLLTADTDRAGLTFHFVYDREGRCVESWGDYPGRRDPSLAEVLPNRLADGQTRVKGIHHCRFDYMPNGYSEVADSTQVRRFFGNERGTLDKSVEGGGVMTATYRDDGHILSRTEPMGATTTFERDARGRVLAVTDPLGRTTRVERDSNGLAVLITDPAGGVTRIERDARGNPLMLIDPLGAVTTLRYEDRGLVTEHVSPTGARTTYAYDAQGNLIAITLPNAGVFRFTYDALGRQLSRTDPLGAETRYSFSDRGDLVAVRDALGEVMRFAYDGEGHLTQLLDPKGQATQLAWGGYHKLCNRKDANGNTVRFRYNLEGELLEVHNERGEVHRLTYSTSGVLTGETTFDGRELRYRSDLAGRVVSFQNGARESIRMEYDLAGQLVKREFDDGSIAEFTYDALGKLISAKGSAGEFHFERDAVGRIVRERQVVAGEESWTEIVYDAAGVRVGRKTSLGHTEVVMRGALGERVRTVLDGAHPVDHQADLLGRETARALPGGGWLQSQYDAMGRVARRRAGGTAARAGRAGEPEWLEPRSEGLTIDTVYRYNEIGELTESWDAVKGRTQYAYDPISQLLAMVPEKARAELFRYDDAGNVREDGGGAQERVYGRGNRLLRKGNTEYTWDGDGRLIEKRSRSRGGARDDTWRYAWDAAGLLRSVERPDGLRAEYAYDPFARRVSKRVTRAGSTGLGRDLVSETRFVWDGDVLVHELESRARASGDPVIEERTYWFEDGGFAPVAHHEHRADDIVEVGEWFHYVNDPIGTPERLLDAAGEVACELRRKAWGETEEAPGGRASTRIRLQGQYEDAETGLFCTRFRYFDPDAGRWISADPIGLDGGAICTPSTARRPGRSTPTVSLSSITMVIVRRPGSLRRRPGPLRERVTWRSPLRARTSRARGGSTAATSCPSSNRRGASAKGKPGAMTWSWRIRTVISSASRLSQERPRRRPSSVGSTIASTQAPKLLVLVRQRE